MNLQEAYENLGLTSSATQDEVKKRYRELTKKYHPDVNKASDATDKFKKINEAYSKIQSGEDDQPMGIGFSGFNPFGRQRIREVENIFLSITISFAESVLGVKRELSFKRTVRCNSCNGQGEININNGCDKCGGKGVIINNKGNMIFTMTCNKCYGKFQVKSCEPCQGKGAVEAESNVNVTIPGGIKDENILRLESMGNFVGNGGFGLGIYTDAFLKVNVTPEDGLSLQGSDVISDLTISLAEAVKGCNKSVKTINGMLEIEVKPHSRNKDEIIISGLGVNKIGNQKVYLDVVYPENIEEIINR